MAPACASPMLTPGYTAGGYWEDGVSLRVVANGEWVGGEGASKLEHRRRGGGDSSDTGTRLPVCTGYNFA